MKLLTTLAALPAMMLSLAGLGRRRSATPANTTGFKVARLPDPAPPATNDAADHWRLERAKERRLRRATRKNPSAYAVRNAVALGLLAALPACNTIAPTALAQIGTIYVLAKYTDKHRDKGDELLAMAALVRTLNGEAADAAVIRREFRRIDDSPEGAALAESLTLLLPPAGAPRTAWLSTLAAALESAATPAK
jgi:hypothetical protein